MLGWGRTNQQGTSLGGALIWFAGSGIVAIAGYLAVNAAASRLLGAADFGYFVILITSTTFLSQLGLVGVHRSGLREAARLSDGDHEELTELRRGVRAVTQLVLPATGAAAAFVAWFLAPDQAGGARIVLAVEVGLLVVLGGHQKLWSTYLRGFGQVRLASLIEGRSGGALVAVLQSVGLLTVLLLVPELELVGAVGAAVVGYAIPVYFAHRQVHQKWRALPKPRRAIRDLRRVVRRDWRFASSQTAGALNTNVEIWMVGVALSATDTSLFGAAQRLAVLLIIPLVSIQIVFSPAIARLTASDNRQTLARVLQTGAFFGFAVSLIFALPLMIAPGRVLSVLFGPEFAGAAAVLVVLVVGYLSTAFAGLAGPALSMTHNEGVVATMNWVALAARVALGGAAVLLVGIQGIAISASIVTALMYFVLWRRTRQLVGVSTLPTPRPSFALIRQTPG